MDCRYQPGQVWSYKKAAREDSCAIVGVVEDVPGTGVVVSISITNVYLPHWETGEPALNAISHVPMTVEAMDASAVAQTGTCEPIPGFAEARAEWRDMVAKKEAGAFTIPIAEVAKYIAEAVAKGH
jgi:hypothetical protein